MSHQGGYVIERLSRIAHHVFALLIFSASFAFALDAPHTNLTGYGIGCANCHWMQSSATPPWTTVQNPPDPADNTINNRRCYACHDGSKSAIPGVKTHSASTTGSAYWSVKGGWKTECVTCHNPHQQRQTRAWGTLTYLVTGSPPLTIGSWETGNRTKITVAETLTENYYGYYLLPDKNYPFFYKIATDTRNTNIFEVQGDVLEQYVETGGYAIVYGKNVMDYIDYTNPGGKGVGGVVKLGGNSGTNGPGDSVNKTTGVCYVCHTQTTHWSASSGDTGHNDKTNCEDCHQHLSGFKPSCNICHGYPPNAAVTMTYGSANGNNPALQTGNTDPGAHSAHVTTNGLVCANCHQGGMISNVVLDKVIQIGFNLATVDFSTARYKQLLASYVNGYTVGGVNAGGPGTNGTCSNVYCHGSTMPGNGGTNNIPTWNIGATGQCGTCHGATAAVPPQLGSHVKHAGAVSGYSFACTLCHNTDAAQHVNGAVDWAFSTGDGRTNGGKYNDAASGSTNASAPSATYGSCSNLYCHSNGTSVSTGTVPGNTSPTWGTPGPLACDSCHGSGTGNGMPNYPNGSPKANTHAAHVNQTSHPSPYNNAAWAFTMTCKTCHSGTTTDDTSIALKSAHVNRSYDLQASGQTLPNSGRPVSFTYSPLPSGGQCFNVSCHRGATVYWGGSNGGYCGASSCHQSATYGQTLVSIAVAPINPRVEMNTAQQFTATALYSNNVTQDVTLPAQWSSSDTAVATPGTDPYSYGVIRTGNLKGTTTITATLGGVSGSTTLEVTEVRLVSITVAPANSSVPLGKTAQFTAMGAYSDNSVLDITTSVTWNSSHTAVAAISNASGSKGLAASTAVGTTTISAQLGNISGSTGITVTEAELVSILVTPPDPTIAIGATQQFTATGIYTDASTQDFTSIVNWSSSDEAVAIINAAGLATATGVSTATITATDPVTLISGSTTLTVVTLSGAVLPLYVANGFNWNDYVKNDRSSIFAATDTACAGTEIGGYNACLHGGEMRKVDVAGKSTCDGLTALDALGAFDWVCDGSVNPVRMVSTGLKDGKYLSDLIDFSGPPVWKADNVTVSYNGSPYLAASSAVWWNNPIVVNNAGGNLSSPGTIYVATVNPSAGYEMTADKVSLLTAPSVTLHTNSYSSYLIDASSNPSYKFLWIEGSLDASNNGDGTGGGSNMAVMLKNTNFSVLRNARVANSMAHSGAYSLYLYGCSNNKVTDFSSDRGYEGLYIYGSPNNIFSNVSISHHQDGFIFAGGSNNNALTDVSANSNSNGFSISSAYNIFSNVRASDNTGVGISLGGSFNTLKGVNSSNNGDKGLSLGGANNRLLNVSAFNNASTGILINNSPNNVLADVTASNNYGTGIVLSGSSFNILMNVVTAANVSYGLGLYSNSTGNTVENLSSANNGGYGIDINSTSYVYNTFTGLLKVGNNYFAACNVTGPSDGLVNGTCANSGASNASLTTGISIASSFVAKVPADSTNLDGATGTEVYNSITDWRGFENGYRGWGLDNLSAFPAGGNEGRCSANLTCRIWDWSLISSDTVIRGAIPQNLSGNAITVYWQVSPGPTSQANCTAAVPGSYYSGNSCINTFLRNAVEIGGNGNALCEGGETCLYTPNFGAYQGHGNLISAGAAQMMQYDTNGR